MAKKTYRSAQGKPVDLGALQLTNENVRAVGNMGVNARGDVIDTKNKTVDSRANRIGKTYKKQITNVVDDFVPKDKNDQPKTFSKAEKRAIKVESEVPQDLDMDTPIVQEPEVESVVTQPAPVEEEKVAIPAGGLADAIARARTVKQEPMKTPRQMAKERAGVKKI